MISLELRRKVNVSDCRELILLEGRAKHLQTWFPSNYCNPLYVLSFPSPAAMGDINNAFFWLHILEYKTAGWYTHSTALSDTCVTIQMWFWWHLDRWLFLKDLALLPFFLRTVSCSVFAKFKAALVLDYYSITFLSLRIVKAWDVTLVAF